MEKDGHEMEVITIQPAPKETSEKDEKFDDDFVEREWMSENGIVIS